jgi:general secretion pathway protein J
MTRRGFTLLEVLIAIVVLGLVIVLLDQGVAFGVRAAATQQRTEATHGDLEAVDRAIRQLIAQADPGIAPAPPLFRGLSGSLALVTLLPTGAEPERVDALLFHAGDDLRLRWTRRRHVLPFGPPPAPQERVLLTGVSGLALAYSDGSTWVSSWTALRLPALIRVTLKFDDPRRRWPPIEVAPVREALAR